MIEYSAYDMSSCRLCPRECGADRTGNRRGRCGASGRIMVARAALHFWEEPCISGHSGSGAVFFTGCPLGCIFCQNSEISFRVQKGGDLPGKEVSVQDLSGIFLRLCRQGANNINLVTASHHIPQVAEAIRLSKKQGLNIPVIYNTSGYEKVSSLRMLEGLVDVYLPDFKYMSPDTAKEYSAAQDYPERVKEAIAEMVRQTGRMEFCPEAGADAGGRSSEKSEVMLIRKGVIVRHLLLPGHVNEAKEIVRYLYDTYGNSIFISLMNQYTPMSAVKNHPLLGRRVTKREYERLINYALEIGVKNGFIQEGGTAKESFIPAWNGEGVGNGEEVGNGERAGNGEGAEQARQGARKVQ